MSNIIGEIQADLDTIAARAVKQTLEVIKLREENARLRRELAEARNMAESNRRGWEDLGEAFNDQHAQTCFWRQEARAASSVVRELIELIDGQGLPTLDHELRERATVVITGESPDDHPSPDYDGALGGVADG